MTSSIGISRALADVKCEIRGDLSRRAYELERLGYELFSLKFLRPLLNFATISIEGTDGANV